MAKEESGRRLEEALSGAGDRPVAIIARQGSPTVSVYTGSVATAERLAQIPLQGEAVLALVPFHQIRERGFEALEGEEPLLYMLVEEQWDLPVTELLPMLPTQVPLVADGGFDISDEEYADLVRRVIVDEIGEGEGANFVLRRTYRAKAEGPQKEITLAWLAALLKQEVGAYWTFAFYGGGVAAVGASPERHVSAANGTVLMNPISGTMRHGPTPPTEEDVLAFLADVKESEELVMVVDEELKMMSTVCPDGGVMRGPYLKPMSRLTHTEYLLEGKSRLDPREVLRLTMFAPTVVGSPMGAACEVIAKYEGSSRGYYSGVLALFQREGVRYSLDAPILIRTAFISPNGDVEVSAGATLVRHSDPEAEAKETHVKVSGLLSAVGLGDTLAVPTRAGANAPAAQAAKDKRVLQALAARNRDLAPFWRDEQSLGATVAASVLLVDLGDEFSTMLAHQLRHLGLSARVLDWAQVTGAEPEDLFIFGPGTGDPTADTRKTRRVKELMMDRMGAGKPLAATSFSHLLLADLAGLPIVNLEDSRQGVALDVPFVGEQSLLGFYATFAALGEGHATTPALDLKITAVEDPTAIGGPEKGSLGSEPLSLVTSLEGTTVVSTAAHLESVLSRDGFDALARMVVGALQP